jgi:phage repressor protein C with HTH and peptisase S24 domain
VHSAPGIIDIPVLDVSAAAGSGRVQDVISAVDTLPFPLTFVERLAPHDAKLSSLRCAGNSMEPTITDGAILIIDEHQNRLPPPHPAYRKTPRVRAKPDDIYVFFHSEDLRLKRLRALDHGFVAIYSDNHAEHPIEITKPGQDGALKIVGKVIWWDNRL